MALSLGGVRVIDRSSDPEANDESYCFAVPNRNKAGVYAAAQVTAGVGAE